MTWFSLGLQIQADLPAALELALQDRKSVV